MIIEKSPQAQRFVSEGYDNGAPVVLIDNVCSPAKSAQRRGPVRARNIVAIEDDDNGTDRVEKVRNSAEITVVVAFDEDIATEIEP